MLSPELLKFLVARDVEEHTPQKEEKEIKKSTDGAYRYKRYVTVPIEIQK